MRRKSILVAKGLEPQLLKVEYPVALRNTLGGNRSGLVKVVIHNKDEIPKLTLSRGYSRAALTSELYPRRRHDIVKSGIGSKIYFRALTVHKLGHTYHAKLT